MVASRATIRRFAPVAKALNDFVRVRSEFYVASSHTDRAFPPNRMRIGNRVKDDTTVTITSGHSLPSRFLESLRSMTKGLSLDSSIIRRYITRPDQETEDSVAGAPTYSL
jgi:hypothetical protein